jgi:hypothetical protein
MVQLIAVAIEVLETLVTMLPSKRNDHRGIGNLGKEAHRDNRETIVK